MHYLSITRVNFTGSSDYMNMPQKEGDVLTMLVTTQAGESEGIVFCSRDGGETWEYMEK